MLHLSNGASPILPSSDHSMISAPSSRTPSAGAITIGEMEQMVARLRADCEDLQEQNMMLIRERDEYKERSKREVSIVDDT